MPGPENNMVADFFEFLFFGIETAISSFEEIEEIRYFGHLKSSDPNIRIPSPHTYNISSVLHRVFVRKKRSRARFHLVICYLLKFEEISSNFENHKNGSWSKHKIFLITVTYYHSNEISVFAAFRCVLHF